MRQTATEIWSATIHRRFPCLASSATTLRNGCNVGFRRQGNGNKFPHSIVRRLRTNAATKIEKSAITNLKSKSRSPHSSSLLKRDGIIASRGFPTGLQRDSAAHAGRNRPSSFGNAISRRRLLLTRNSARGQMRCNCPSNVDPETLRGG